MVRLYRPIQDPTDRGAWWATVQGVSKQQQPSINISLKVLVVLFQKYLTNNNLWKTELHVNNISYSLGLKNIHVIHIPIFTYYPRHTHMQTRDGHINACKHNGDKSIYFRNNWKWVTQSYLTLCDPMNYTVHGILQARILGWVAISFSKSLFPTQGSNPGLPHCRQILY